METKIAQVKQWFEGCRDAAARYERIIKLGRSNPLLPSDQQIPENRVKGCQSTLYLFARLEGDVMRFAAQSDALISSGLAVLLTSVYDGEKPEVVIKEEPLYLEELGIPESLSPSRANGLAALRLRMRQEALQALVGA